MPRLKRSFVTKSLVGCRIGVIGCPVRRCIMAVISYAGSVADGIVESELSVEVLLTELASSEDVDGETVK